MNEKLHICVVADGYPSEKYPFFTFVKELCCEFADLGLIVTVIAPQSKTQNIFRGTPKNPIYRQHVTNKGNKINIFQPFVITLGNLKYRGRSLSRILFKYAIKKCFNNLRDKPDICYGHFWHNAYFLFESAKNLKLPLFVASGEARIDILDDYPLEKIKDFTDYVHGVICVSTKNKIESIYLGLTTDNKCRIFPNSIDTNKFYKKDKLSLRKHYGIDNNDFIVVFVGGFIHRKGIFRVAEAISLTNDKSIKSFFIGGNIGGTVSNITLNCEGILYCGRVPHHQLVDYLNCADVFVLPTLAEGCCNAILEAMACGLPIISSNLSFNDDILRPEYSIRIDPLNIYDISNSILYLKNNPLIRENMSNNAFKASRNFEIKNRAENIYSFIRSKTSFIPIRNQGE